MSHPPRRRCPCLRDLDIVGAQRCVQLLVVLFVFNDDLAEGFVSDRRPSRARPQTKDARWGITASALSRALTQARLLSRPNHDHGAAPSCRAAARKSSRS